MAFTKHRDTDLSILQLLDDKTLFSVCLVNKYVSNLCKNEDFWRNRYKNRFNSTYEPEKPSNISWKNYYLETIYNLNSKSLVFKEIFRSIVPFFDTNQTMNELLLGIYGKIYNLKELPKMYRDVILYRNIPKISFKNKEIPFKKTYIDKSYIFIVEDLIKTLKTDTPKGVVIERYLTDKYEIDFFDVEEEDEE